MDLSALDGITDPQALRALLADAQAIIAHKDALLSQRDQSIERKEALIGQLRREIARLRRLQFSARSERMDPEQRQLFEETMAADIAAGQATLAAITGQTPRYFRATAGLRNPFLDPVLHRLGIRLAAWTRRPYDTRCGDPETVLARLCRDLGPGDILLLHDGHAARTADGQPVILAVLPRLLATLRDQQLNPVTLNDAIT